MEKQNKIIKIMKISAYTVIFIACLAALIKPSKINHPDKLNIATPANNNLIVETLLQKYKKQSKIINKSTEKALQDVIKGNVDIAVISRNLNPNETKQLKSITIGYDAIAIATNLKNPITDIDKSTLQAIYTEEINNWESITKINMPIMLFSQKPENASSELFEEYSGLLKPYTSDMVNKKSITANTHIASSDIECTGFIAKYSGSIGYASYATILDLKNQNLPIKIISINNVYPNKETILNNTYPIKAVFNIVYKQETPEIKKIIELSLTNEVQDKIQKLKFIPVIKEIK